LRIHHAEVAPVYLDGVRAAELEGHTTDHIEMPLRDAVRRALKEGPNLLAGHCRKTIGGQYIDVGRRGDSLPSQHVH
jgi:hypothetical protein